MKALFLFFLLAFSSTQISAQEFLVGNIQAKTGEAVSGFLDVPAGSDEGTQIPVSVFRGSNPGPVLALISGTHGYEYAPIIALQRLRNKLDPKQISGTVIMVHVANMPSFLKRTIYYSPVDGKNLNRMYPGKQDGTISQRIAFVVTKEVIEKADYVLDLHCGDGNENLRPYSYWMTIDNPDVDAKSKELALAFGLDHIVIDNSLPRNPAESIYTSNTATTRGKPAITTESGALGQTDEQAVSITERGVLNVMKHLKMYPGDADTVQNPVWLEGGEVLRSQSDGIFYPLVDRGITVAQGTVLGYVTDFFGKKLFDVKAPFAGEVLYVLGTPPVSKGEPLAFVAKTRVQ
ncbi:MAG TPA: M14 family metallopeptidase [Acidobacteriota bacterium]|nr:M14 family metallopeptidase [Acidobacteriota bacterium]